jgi:hypothetical protein
MQISFLQRSQDSPLSKAEWRTNQVFNRAASSKQAVTAATPTVATMSFVAATSSHDPNPILQSSDPDSDKTRSAVPLLANSATKSWSSARARRLGETFCSSLIRPLQHSHSSSNRCVGQTLTVGVLPGNGRIAGGGAAGTAEDDPAAGCTAT